MATKIVDNTPPEEKPDPKVAEFEAGKAAFEAAASKSNGEAESQEEETPKPKRRRKAAEPHPLETEVATLRAQVAELSKPKEPESDERAEIVRSRLAQRFGEDEANDLVDTFTELRGEDRRRIEQLERMIEGAAKAGRANLSRSNQRRLAEGYPQLKGGAAWRIVHEQAMAAYERNPKDYDSIEDAYDEMASALYGEPEDDETEAPEAVQRVASRIAASQMTVPTKTARRENRSLEERQREHFEFMKKNPHDKAGQLRLAQELGLRK